MDRPPPGHHVTPPVVRQVSNLSSPMPVALAKNHPPTHDLPRRGDFSPPGVAALRLPWVRDIPT
ncbi:MAG: hypothetical protein ACK56I_27630, partial [bacterium]